MEKIIELLSSEDMCRIDIINEYHKVSVEISDYTTIEEYDRILILQGNDEYSLLKTEAINDVSDVSKSFDLCYADGSHVYVSFPFLYD